MYIYIIFFKAVIIIMCKSFSKIIKNTYFCCASTSVLAQKKLFLQGYVS